MTDETLLRHARHIMLDGLGLEGVAALQSARVLVVGAGGLGCTAALYLAAAGVGTLVLADADTVELSNLQRQIAHHTTSVGQLKVDSLAERCQAINPHTAVERHACRADPSWLANQVPRAHVVLDCTDNFQTRHAINAACVAARVPLVSAAALRMDAQWAVFDARVPESPCYACAFPANSPSPDAACATLGVLAPLVGMAGSWQAAQAIGFITGCSKPPLGQLTLLDARNWQQRAMRLSRNPSCEVCGPAA